ncbi:HD family phosphohydrolase [Ereboglobus luteus]|uniref:HD domain-containing protein n=1 Tax=Ereboglobus luteus TaxID=1796921 RepID=A0A2U8E4U0_9BACT|nr:HDIG domain-containing metalloprotein [Ereboglobus luteus]AWI09564.1 hypothetical protein CKA38_10205 [Ereboglobus luteus]
MSLIDTLRTLPGGGQQPRKRKTLVNSRVWKFLATHRLVTTLILIATASSIVFISYVGINSSSIPIYPNQVAGVQITANVAFDYVSHQQAELTREQIRNRVPRVYKLDDEPLKKFEAAIKDLLADLDTFEKRYPPEGAEDPVRTASFNALLVAFNARGPYNTTAAEVRTLLDIGDANRRREIAETALQTLREICKDGIQDNALAMMTASDGTSTLLRITRPGGESVERTVRTLENARSELRVSLASEGLRRRTIYTIARIFDNGLAPNIRFDEVATEALKMEATIKMPSPVVHVEKGQIIIENGKRVTSEQYEMLEAYRAYQLEHNTESSSADMQFLRRILVVLAMVLACAIYMRIEDPETLQSNGRLALLALVVVFNLALVRVTYWLSELPYFMHHSEAASILPYLAPTAIAPIIVVILIDAGSAIFMALLISVFTSVIYGNRLDVLVLTFFASIIATYQCRHVRRRSSIMRAALYGGIAVSCFALLFGIIDQQSFLGPDFTVPRQILTGLINGVITGVIVVGLLPIIETLFQRTTDITLLELTDYNHPLLRRMQMEAPGTYHHSLVVAQLAENAANAIGANPLLARVCALFHDIGKTNKPEYFTENQRDRANPHDENNPSLSALIIKAHVKDGVDLAIKNKLPRAVIDVIQQHHGTSLIRFFYHRALGEKRYQASGSASPIPHHGGTTPPVVVTRPPFAIQNSPGLDPVPVSESTYRYDGPRPQFKESAIILLADGVEAASRSMRKVTPQHLGELIDQIFRDRMDDEQLDDAPLTFADLNKIRNSFVLTLLNMLHSRVAYPPTEEKTVEQTNDKGTPPADALQPEPAK